MPDSASIMKCFYSFIAMLTAIMLFTGSVTASLGVDTASSYRLKVSQVDIYENTIDTALPQTAVYDTIEAHFASPLPAGKTVKKAIFIGYDGCRADALLYRTAGGAIDTVSSDGSCLLSYAGGLKYPLVNTQFTSTGPGWCTMLTGKWGSVTGIINNDQTLSVKYPTLLRSLITDGKCTSTAFYTSWSGHFISKNSTYIDEKNYCAANGIAASFVKCDDDAGTAAGMAADVSSASCSDFIFGILEGTDEAGHSKGFSPYLDTYKQALTDDEAYASSVIAAIKARPAYDSEDWLFIISSDHGGYGLGHGGPTIQERYTFIAANKTIVSAK